ncbi:MAG TPA: hypothetical protein VEC57_06535 [Candidatus Limnocylindrales bacterium]|nr:hypothetical protein [Candidatus Limnocylindrales bacterium]
MRHETQPIQTIDPVSADAGVNTRTLAHMIAIIGGVVFLLITVLGFVQPGFLGAHLSMTHNLIHLVSGATSLYFGLYGTISGARLFCFVFAVVYGGLALAGFALGGAGEHSFADIHHGGDSLLLRVLPGNLELGLHDHLIHVVIAAMYLAAGIWTSTKGASTEPPRS